MVKAIDIMNYYLTPEAKKKWEDAKADEMTCRMEASVDGGLPSLTPAELVAQMDESGVEKTLLCGCYMFSYWQRKMIYEPNHDAIIEAVRKYPDRLVGIAGYNPFRIPESIKELERVVKEHSFKGVYIHIYGFDMPLTDARMYPLYGKCLELDIPISMQVGHVLEAMPSEHARPIMLDRISLDFPGIKLIGAHTGFPWCDELISVCYKHENVYFGADAWSPRQFQPSVVKFIDGWGRKKSVWGTNGLPPKLLLDQMGDLDVRDEARDNLLRETAVKLFKL